VITQKGNGPRKPLPNELKGSAVKALSPRPKSSFTLVVMVNGQRVNNSVVIRPSDVRLAYLGSSDESRVRTLSLRFHKAGMCGPPPPVYGSSIRRFAPTRGSRRRLLLLIDTCSFDRSFWGFGRQILLGKLFRWLLGDLGRDILLSPPRL